MADSGPLKGPDPWVHIRAHAAEGGLYACAIKELLERLQHLEARPEVQVLPTTSGQDERTVLVPTELVLQTTRRNPSFSLEEWVGQQLPLLPDGRVDSERARSVIHACADWLATAYDIGGTTAARLLLRGIDRG